MSTLETIYEDLTGVETIEIIEEGPAGASAYQVAVLNGFEGTEEEWLASLKGEPGTTTWAGIADKPATFPPEAHGHADKADLVDGKVPAGQLPSYVDDVLEYANLAGFPVAGETGKIYVALDTGSAYRWSGSAYAEISQPYPAATQEQAEDLAGTTLLSWTVTRIRQLVDAVLALGTSVFKGIMGGGYKEALYTLTTIGDTTLDLVNGNVQRLILGGAHQLTMPADPGFCSQSFVLRLNCAGYTPTWNATPTIVWMTFDGQAPALNTTSGKINVLAFLWDDTLGRWEGYLAGKEA